MSRFIIKEWVCDWGIYDNVQKKFIGKPIHSHLEALVVLNWLLIGLDYHEIEIINKN